MFGVALGGRASTLRAMKAKVIVMPKQNILDPQGVAVRDAIRHHGIPAVTGARVGKCIELEVEGEVPEGALHELCRDLLSNPVVEDYRLEVERTK
jgi:phosphoribosylformylglycinamidine synthase PurS subunit